MEKPTRRKILIAAITLGVVALIVIGFLPEAVPVQTETVTSGPLQVIVEAEGETRVAERYVISAPVPAFVRRIELEPGDLVEAGQPVAWYRAADLDPRGRAQALARVDAAAASLQQAEVAAERAQADLARTRRLHEGGSATRLALEQAEAEAARALAARDAARAELAAARAALQYDTGGEGDGPAAEEPLRAPVAGRVLRVHQESEGAVVAGQALVEIGDANRLQLRADVLSQDAVRIRPGTRVLVEEWGGEIPLEAVVARVEPEAYVRVSALGVEERRVPVIAEFAQPPSADTGLGAGYRVLARFVVWEADDVVQAPTSALFRSGDKWAAFVVEGGRATLREVRVGQRAGLVAEILEGLAPGDVVVIHPPNDLEDGARVRQP